ncbi:MAG TPA: 16S rRNA (guanine(527)-N(7))-methyltransferase RsmG, partial [Flavipsychrobacter sp.]|nr:16S rRNA (guanine(527)-N(7))-methyltransferase RsmG [Flavipsychrobacter sp.]
SPALVKGKKSDELHNGLLCLKGGNLEEEIKQSGLDAQAWSVHDIFEEPYFEEKYAIYVSK